MAEPAGPLESKTVVKRRQRLSPVWIVPIVAALVGVWVAVTRILERGPTITIVFDTAEGLEAGKTTVHYNGVEVGKISSIRLSDDHQQVVTTVDMQPKTEDLLADDTRFWVVRPRISGANVTGLGTLISGAYIGMEIGKSHERKREFVALTTPPVVHENTPGRFFALRASSLGSLDYGAPIFFRRFQVGEVASYELDKDGHGVTVKVFVNAPYDQYVTTNTRFWQASGVDVSLTAAGLKVQTQSALAILIGGIAFETPPGPTAAAPAASDAVFTLFDNRADAYKPNARNPEAYLLVFHQSVRGLTVGAPVEFRGIQIGEVVSITPELDVKTQIFSVNVTVVVDPLMFGVRMTEGAILNESVRQATLSAMVEHGLRAQLQSGNLLTGSLYVSVDFFPDAPPATVDWSQKPPQIATVPNDIEAIEKSVASLAKKLDELPLKPVVDDLRKTIVKLDATLASAQGTFDNANRLVAPNSALGQELHGTLEELDRAARGLRVLADYLERHPEALIRGKGGD